jgi:hypothetical protein
VPAEDDQVSAGLDSGDAGDEGGGLAYKPEYGCYEQGDDEDGEGKSAKERDQRESCMEM